MMRKSLGVLAATGLLATAAAVPAAAQDSRVVTIPEGEPIKLGMMFVTSGANAVLGEDQEIGVEVAKEDRGQLLGHDIELILQDSLCTPEGGAQAAQALTSDPDIIGIVGPTCSGAVDGAAQIISEAGLTHISGSSTAPALTFPDREDRFAGTLRTAWSDAVQGKLVAEYVFNELGLSKAATIHDGSIYAESLVGVFGDEFEALGGEITLATAVNDGQTDMVQALTNVAESGPELLYFPIFTDEGGFIVDQAADVAGMEGVTLFGSDGLFSSAFIEAAGPNVEGMYLSAANFDLLADTYPAMLERYLEIGNVDAPLAPFHGHTYDAANIFFNAVEAVAVENDDGSLSIDLGELREAIYATTDYEGVTGTLSCTEDGDCGAAIIGVYQVGADTVEDGVFPPALVWPAE
jgi:branched-chain amino acid transport system substrate-binding protein